MLVRMIFLYYIQKFSFITFFPFFDNRNKIMVAKTLFILFLLHMCGHHYIRQQSDNMITWCRPYALSNRNQQSVKALNVLFLLARNNFVYVLHCPSGPGLNMPMLLDTSGFFLRREGLRGHYICSAIPPLVSARISPFITAGHPSHTG